MNAAQITAEWQARLLDHLAAQTDAISAGQLASYATSQVVKLTREHNVNPQDVMTWTKGFRHPTLEISTATVNRFLAKRSDVVDMGKREYAGRTSKAWALKPNVEAWREAHATKAERDETIKARVVLFDHWDRYVIALDGFRAAEWTHTRNSGWNNGEPVYTQVLPKDFAQAEAESFARRLRIQLVKAAAA